MRTIKELISNVKKRASAARYGIALEKLHSLTAHSGLGDSAFLLYGLVKAAKPEVVVEIGSARGRSTCFIGKALQENGHGKVFAIDPHTRTDWNDDDSTDTYEILLSNVTALGLQDVVEICRSTSDNVATKWKGPIDMLFIDGDHSYEGALHDWQSFVPFVRPFGSVIFHDTLWDLKPDQKYSRPDMGVPRLVDELRVAGYPVITIDRDFGVSLIQPTLKGTPLRHETNPTAKVMQSARPQKAMLGGGS